MDWNRLFQQQLWDGDGWAPSASEPAASGWAVRGSVGAERFRVNAARGVLLALVWTLAQTTFFAYQLHQLRAALVGSRLGITTTGDDLTTWLVLFLLLWFTTYLVTLVHEGGHFLVGWLLGFEFHSFQVGLLKLVRARDGVRLRLDTGRLSGGAVSAFPFSGRFLRLRWVLVVAAGPLMSVLFGLVAWRLLVSYLSSCLTDSQPTNALLSAFTGNADPRCLAIAVGGGFPSLDPLLIGLLLFLMWEAVVSGLENLLLPYVGRQGVGDGFRLFRLLLGTTSSKHDLAALQLTGYSTFAVRPQEWPPELVRRRLALAQTQRDRHLAFFYAYYWALDLGYITHAGEYLDQTLATCPVPITRVPILALEVAYFEARYRANREAARESLRQAKHGESRAEAILRPRALAAICLLEGNYTEAASAANAALDALGARLLADATLPEQWMQEEEEQLRRMLVEAQQWLGMPTHQPSAGTNE